jgi:hypothetical protein
MFTISFSYLNSFAVDSVNTEAAREMLESIELFEKHAQMDTLKYAS